MSHFLLRCPKPEAVRSQHNSKIESLLGASQDEEEVVACILDPSHISTDEETNYNLESATRRYCYTLHRRRAEVLGLSTGRIQSWGHLITCHSQNRAYFKLKAGKFKHRAPSRQQPVCTIKSNNTGNRLRVEERTRRRRLLKKAPKRGSPDSEEEYTLQEVSKK